MYDFKKLKFIFKEAKLPILDILNNSKMFNKYGLITNKRIAHFIAQMAWESDRFTTLEEYASGSAYEGRADLGNVLAGDGIKFKGRGLIQLTGRANYREYGRRIGLDLVANPEEAADPKYVLELALIYWTLNRLNDYADKDDISSITRKINGGFNGLSGRTNNYNRLKDINFLEGVSIELPGSMSKTNTFVLILKLITWIISLFKKSKV